MEGKEGAMLERNKNANFAKRKSSLYTGSKLSLSQARISLVGEGMVEMASMVVLYGALMETALMRRSTFL